MKIPREIRTYCKKCRTHTQQAVKRIHKGKRRTMSIGQRRFDRRKKGYTSKIGEKVDPVKQSKKQVVLLECRECGKKKERKYPRSRKNIEIGE